MERAFAAISKARPAGINVLPDPVFSAYSSRIAAFAASAGLPSVSANAAYAEAGGLMAYGPSFPEMARSAAGFVAKILKGDKPGTLAVERPTKFELVINRKAAREIALTIPPSLQLRADRVIE
jgi:putative ABC transport system substrate-binding protein